MGDVGDEDEEEARSRREGDQDLEQVPFGEPVSDGAAHATPSKTVSLCLLACRLFRLKEGTARTPRRKETTRPGNHSTAEER